MDHDPKRPGQDPADIPEAFRNATVAAAARATYVRRQADEHDLARLEQQLTGLGVVVLPDDVTIEYQGPDEDGADHCGGCGEPFDRCLCIARNA